MTDRDLERLVIELTDGKRPWDVALADLCRAVRTVLGVSAASVLVVSGAARGLTAGSDDTVEGLEELQIILGEGPAVEAVRHARPVLVGDLVLDQPRWPQLAARAIERGVAAMFAFPLPLGLVPLGVLTLYRDSRGPLSMAQRRLAMRTADAIVEIVLAAQAHECTDEGLAAPVAALHVHRVVVDQAVGMVAAQLDCEVAEAAVRLRAYAYAQDQPLDVIARAVIDRQLRFER